jgi:hypothetical protein
MGASNYTYAEATLTQSLPDWIGAHVRALAFMGGVPAQLVPDNPKVGVDRANWYEPGLNRTYLDLATHYRTAILPTRTRKPRDKAKVEVAVLVVERWILARLRNRRFFSLAELNRAIWELVADLNARPMRRLVPRGFAYTVRSTGHYRYLSIEDSPLPIAFPTPRLRRLQRRQPRSGCAIASRGSGATSRRSSTPRQAVGRPHGALPLRRGRSLLVRRAGDCLGCGLDCGASPRLGHQHRLVEVDAVGAAARHAHHRYRQEMAPASTRSFTAMREFQNCAAL